MTWSEQQTLLYAWLSTMHEWCIRLAGSLEEHFGKLKLVILVAVAKLPVLVMCHNTTHLLGISKSHWVEEADNNTGVGQESRFRIQIVGDGDFGFSGRRTEVGCVAEGMRVFHRSKVYK